MLEIRPACPEDVPAVAAVVEARSGWMELRGLPSWRGVAGDLAGQAAAVGTQMWVLTHRGRVIGFTTLAGDRPLWGWTSEEAGEDAFYLYTTCTHPAYRACRPGSLIAWWAVDKAFAEGRAWVRRGCLSAGLVGYYTLQGFEVVHEVQRKNALVYLMARRAQPVPELGRMFAAGGAAAVA